jgi:hypothetical protein
MRLNIGCLWINLVWFASGSVGRHGRKKESVAYDVRPKKKRDETGTPNRLPPYVTRVSPDCLFRSSPRTRSLFYCHI